MLIGLNMLKAHWKLRENKTDITQKTSRLLEESAHFPVLLHIFISTLNENVKLLLIKLDLERKLISQFNPAVRNIKEIETKSMSYIFALWKDTFSKAVADSVV